MNIPHNSHVLATYINEDIPSLYTFYYLLCIDEREEYFKVIHINAWFQQQYNNIPEAGIRDKLHVHF